jgi:tetratricopeptide (TPR) repeat protein
VKKADMSTLIERMQQLQQAEQSLNEVIQEAWRSLPYSPETACAKFLAGEDQVAALSQQWEQWLEEFCAFDALKSVEFRDQTDYRMSQTRSFLAQGKGTALTLLGRLYEAQQAYDRAIALLDDSGNPFQASLTEDLGRLALQQGKFIEAERYYRQAYIRYMQLASPDAWKAIVDSNDVDKSAGFSLEGAVRCLGSLAMVALQRGERDTYLGREMEAIEFAKIHNLYHFERSLWLNLYTWLLHWDAKGEIQAELKQELKNRKRELEQKIQGLERASLKVDMLLLEVENSIALDRATAAEARLKDAQVILEKHTNLVDKSWKLHMAYASFYELQERIGESTEHAEAALEIAREMGWPDFIQQALYMVVSLLDRGAAEHQARKKHILDGTIETLGRVQAGETLARALLQRAEIQLTAKQYDAALADVGGAEALAATRDLRRQVLTAKAAVLKMRGHKEEAYSSLHAAIQLCREQMLPEGQPSAKSYRDLLHQTETLYVGAALLAAELGRAHDAFAWAEQGRSCLLRQQLAQSGRALADDMWSIPQPRYDQKLRESLQTESAAFLFFCIGTGRTLALLLDPQEAVPRPFFLDLKEADLHESR